MSLRPPLASLGLSACILAQLGCAGSATVAQQAAAGGSLVVVQAPAGSLDDVRGKLVDPETRFPEGSRVILVDALSASATRVLSEGLRAAGAPAVSPDGGRVLFAGRADDAGSWAIYEASLTRGQRRLVIRRDDNCTDPAWLAGKRIVVSCRDAGPAGKPLWSLYTSDSKGTDLERITFGPGDAFGPTPLADGRILFSMRQGAGRGRSGDDTVALFTINPDGTLLDAFAGSHQPAAKFGARQVGSESIVFLEQTAPETGPRLRRIDFQHPQRDGTTLLPASGDDTALEVAAVEPMPGGQFLVAVQWNAAGFSLRKFAPDGGGLEIVFDEPGWDEIAAVPVVQRIPPRGRPSPIDRRATTGTVVCYDSERSDHVVGPAKGEAPPARIVVQVATEDSRESTLGELPVAADRSFFVEVPADTPLRVVTLDDGGRAIATSDWFWVRPGERRACFGCHEPRDSAPVNRRVVALAADPVRLPARTRATP